MSLMDWECYRRCYNGQWHVDGGRADDLIRYGVVAGLDDYMC